MKVRLGPALLGKLREASSAFNVGPSDIARKALRKAARLAPAIPPYHERMTREGSEAYNFETPPELTTDPGRLRSILMWYLSLPENQPKPKKKELYIEDEGPYEVVELEKIIGR